MSRAASLERELFIHRGMAAWIEAWSGCSAVGGVAHEHGGSEDVPCRGGDEDRVRLPEGLRAEVAELLAGIAWAVERS